jgi:predicted O-methyltransferase YrrM
MVKNNIFENLGLKDGTSSMTPKQVSQLGTLLPNQNSLNVLEFGSGPTTTLLYNALKTKYSIVKYTTYETDSRWAPSNSEIDVRMHTREELINGKIIIDKGEIYDLVIVDGPDGELRKYWYPLFVNNVKEGTIVHIDDVFHYASFEKDFNKYFPHTNYIFEHGRGLRVIKCWITAQISS